MPPSPALRCSPRREFKAENHKRGRSLESGILFREKDDDLALFNEVQSKEKDNFLLQSNDDFEDVFATRLRYFSDHKVGISIPARGESSDLLNAEGDKNDYDWLLTPPDTPLFPSLDDETPPVNLAPRGRPRSQPITISRTSTMENSYRSSRGSASPNRLSPSPRSAHSTSQPRGRPSSAHHSSPPPKVRHSTPTRRPSPPPSKPSTPVPRSSTPTPRRMSTGSSGTMAPSRGRGNSPVKTSRGNSASPRIKAWQSNIPGFSSEAPPNLRTSLADRPASYVRGSSPASRNGSKSGRQSMSPTPSRSVTSSQSHERNRFSTHSKGSIASSGDDDVDSLQSIPVSTSSAPRSICTFQNNRAKKPNRIVSSSSAPKRSFDLALRQMDHRKAPQNMFRPLLSSVPTSTFYSGKAATTHRTMVSRNSSVTTSSNASTDLGTSGAHDTEESEQNQEEITSACILAPICDVQDQVFVYDEDVTLNEDDRNKVHDASSASQYGELDMRLAVDLESVDNESCSGLDKVIAITAVSDLVGEGDFVNANILEGTVLCSRCGCSFLAIDLTEQDLKLCSDCKSLEVSSATATLLTTTLVGENPPGVSSKLLEHKSLDTLRSSVALTELLEVSMRETVVNHLEVIIKEGQHPNSESNMSVLLENLLAEPLVEKGGKSLLNHPEICESYINHETSGVDVSSQQTQNVSDYPNSKVDVPEGAGISLLLKKSSSGKGHIVQGRSFASSNLMCNDLSYVRDSANSLRSSIGHGSMSTSSSTDLSSVRHIEARIQRQPSGKKPEMENYRYDMHSKHQHSLSSFSGASSHAFQTSSLTTSSHEESSEASAVSVEKNAEEAGGELQEKSFSESKEADITCISENESGCRTASEYFSNVTSIHLDDTLVAPVSNLGNNSSNAMDIEVSSALPETSTAKEDPVSNPCAERIDVEVQNESSLGSMSEMGIENCHLSSPASESDVVSQSSRSSIEMQEPSVPVVSSKDIGASVDESATSNHAHDILEEATVTLEDQGGMKARSLTLEEATDAILFCSSIVHNLAYEAANIAIEKEISIPLEVARPNITVLGKSNADRKDPCGKTVSKRALKSQKVRKQVEKERIPLPSKTEVEDNIEVRTSIVGAPNQLDSLEPPKLESKCNCTIM